MSLLLLMPAHLTTRISESSDCWMLGVHAHGDPSLIDTDRQRQHKVLPPPCRDTKQLQKVFKQVALHFSRARTCLLLLWHLVLVFPTAVYGTDVA